MKNFENMTGMNSGFPEDYQFQRKHVTENHKEFQARLPSIVFIDPTPEHRKSIHCLHLPLKSVRGGPWQ